MFFKMIISSYNYGKALGQFNKKNYSSALKYILKAIEHGCSSEKDVSCAGSLFLAARCFYELHRYEDSIRYAKDSLEIYSTHTDETSAFNNKIKTINIFIENSKKKQQENMGITGDIVH